MDTAQARSRIREAFIQPFDEGRFRHFIHDLLNHVDESKATRWNKTYVKDAFKPRIKKFERVATYTDPQGEKLDVLIIHLERESSLERARTSLRNFAADYLTSGHGQDKSAVLAAFVPPDPTDWRFSFVKLEYETNADDSGRIRVSETLSPARRYSFLVGANEHSHTAQKQFLPLLEQDDADPSLADIEKAFDIEKVTKEFFLRYKDLFESVRDALDKILKRNTAVRDDFDKKGIETDDFAKKLLGQIVFLYFLQKKGWFGVERGDEWGKGNKRFLRYLFDNRAKLRARAERSASRPVNFFNDVLEHLFYDALARERDDDYYPRFDCRIPFLNGGLFEPLFGYDWVNTEILLADQLFSNAETTKEGDTGTGILDVFDRFNFTVNEAEPLEREVAVDPEMLGKVFENLLPENLRHKGGTYYTPRPIVNYMCQQSLINYLSTNLPDVSRDDVETFIRIGYAQADFEAGGAAKHKDKFLGESISRNARKIDKLLEDITVCDPAIGSGAFPVGMMQEIVRAREALCSVEGMPKRTAYKLKRHAIQNSLYGVDIDPGAVEIAKLRLWLSLVVDEDDRDRIQALPNLDYKIMQGNSLLDEVLGVKLFDDRLLEQPAFRDKELDRRAIKDRIAELSQQFVELYRRGSRERATRRAVEKEIEKLKREIKSLDEPSDTRPASAQRTFSDLFSEAQRKLPELRDLHQKIFKTTSPAEKKGLRFRLSELEWEFMEATLREQGANNAVEELMKHRRDNRKDYFLWKLHFFEVFQGKGGFDVVIANPPYVRQEKIKELKPALKASGYECYNGTADLLVYFYERGVKLLRPGGAIALITSNKYYRAGYGEALRGFLARELTLHRLIDFGDAPVFEAIAYASILTGTRDAPPKDAAAMAYTWQKELSFDRITQVVAERGQKLSQSELKPNGWQLDSPVAGRLLEKLRKAGKPLGDYVNGRFYNGVKTGLNEAFVVSRATRDRLISEHKSSAAVLKPFLRGRDAKRWEVVSHDLWLIYIPWHFPLHHDPAITSASKKAEAEFKKQYPAIHAHLHKFKRDLALRDRSETGIRYEWYALARPRYESHSAFAKPKIVIPTIEKNTAYGADSRGHFSNDKTTICVANDINFVMGVLNSKVLWWMIRKTAATKQGGFYEFKPMYVSVLPIPAASPEKRKAVERLVDRILAAKQRDADTDVSALEREIDQLVYALYGLTPEEIQIVEGVAK